MNKYSLRFRWTESRARDTYGYNICTLFVDGVKVARCDGGGYDMEGTVFAEWLEKAFQDRLLKVYQYRISPEHYKGFRGVRIIQEIHLDGACGFSSMMSVAENIGLEVIRVSVKSTNDNYYMVIDKEVV